MEGPGFNWKFIIRIIGFILILESLFLFLSAGVALYYKEWDAQYILLSAVITLACGCTSILFGSRGKIKVIGKRESFFTVSASWLLFACFGMLPFYLSGAIPSLADAFFETMSGATTTGSSILTNVESLPHGLLFWRSIIQWLGGMGMIVFSLALLPLIGGSAAQLYDAETTGITHHKFRPRVGQVAKRLWGIYSILTIVLVLLLYAGPMSFFDAVCHSFATMSTGGYSTKQASIGHWNSTYIDIIITIFMFIGACNFSLIYFFFKGNFKRVFHDEELRWFFFIVITATTILTISLVKDGQVAGYATSLRSAVFQVVSLISTTGFATADYVLWGPFYWILFVVLMIICGCAGSTSGGMKTVRVVVLVKNIWNEFSKQIHPKAIIPVRLNKGVLSIEVVHRIVAFVSLYLIILLFSWVLLAFTGMGLEESLGAAVTAISNTGPGLGINGPNGNFSTIPNISKWYMAFLMLVGRLEIFTVLILFTPGFWKR